MMNYSWCIQPPCLGPEPRPRPHAPKRGSPHEGRGQFRAVESCYECVVQITHKLCKSSDIFEVHCEKNARNKTLVQLALSSLVLLVPFAQCMHLHVHIIRQITETS